MGIGKKTDRLINDNEMSKVKSYLSLIKFSHTIFAMPFALIGFFLSLKTTGIGIGQWNLNKTVAWDDDPWILRWMVIKLLLLIILCMVFA